MGGLLGGMVLCSELAIFWFLSVAGTSTWESGGLVVLLVFAPAAGVVGGIAGAVVSGSFARKPGGTRLVTLLVDAAALALPGVILMWWTCS